VTHGFPPVCDENSRILILGSMPSVKSREAQFYYGHPQNRFWKVLGAVIGDDFPADAPGKRALLLKHHIALWDVIAECDIEGSSDSSIRNVVPNDLSLILDAAPVSAIFVNGGTAARIYRRYQFPLTGREAVQLPSTSPANAAWTLERLTDEWRERISAVSRFPDLFRVI
ncbi:MAG: DNA-deoxyinosine glycosylase, partial [Ruminiclostridium sp.]|nr:DNA-deoxyinosine glycosylase [Ruminiclostridium sp.]